jgi:serine/threonine protein phosphatase PrpC
VATAAAAAVDGIVEALSLRSVVESQFENRGCAGLRAAILASGERWEVRLREEPELRRLPATLAAVVLAHGNAAVAHQGDCRIILIRQGVVCCRTTDHVQRTDDGRRVVTRHFGAQSNPEVHAWEIAADDLLLLTAGVHDVLSEDEVVRCIGPAGPLADQIDDLVERAKRRGGKDPLTALALRIPPRA